jgi:sedoheptulose-bisphosphatase
LRASRVVVIAASEERPVETVLCNDENGFSVAFDPLDGSSIVGANFAVGSIVGVWPGRGLVGRLGREQCAACIAVYGPRIAVALALPAASSVSALPTCVELTWTTATMTPRWVVTQPNLRIAVRAQTFAPGNLRACTDNQAYARTVRRWQETRMTLRYSGGLVPDVYHILLKGEGVMANASSHKAPAKLRLAFEAAPIALLVECAGGASCVHVLASTTATAAHRDADIEPGRSLLDVRIATLARRVGVCYGSRDEVSRFATDVCGAALRCPPLDAHASSNQLADAAAAAGRARLARASKL